MISLPRLLIFASAVLYTVARADAATAATGSPPGLAALLATPKWSTSIGLEAGGGYKDNVLLSPVAPERSGFARYTFDAFLWHLPRGYTDYFAYLRAEETRYFSSESVEHETTASAQLQWRYRRKEKFLFAFDFVGYYFDEIRDVSDTDVTRLVAELKLAGVSVGPTVRWSPRSWIWLEVQAAGKREGFRESTYNGKIGEGTARLGWAPGERFELSVGATDRRRRFDNRQQYSLGGLPLLDTLLVVSERESELRCEVKWDKAGRWKTITRASRLDFTDNGSGFFDYDQRRVSQSLDWKTEKWLVTCEGSAGRREFANQTVGRGVSPPIRITEEFSADLRVERTLSPRWSAYVGYRWERNRSNETIAAYRVNEGLLGARWNWEK